MGDAGPDEARMGLAGQVYVGGEAPAAREQARILGAQDGLADGEF